MNYVIKRLSTIQLTRRFMCTRPSPKDVAESEEKDLNVWGEVNESDTEFRSVGFDYKQYEKLFKENNKKIIDQIKNRRLT